MSIKEKIFSSKPKQISQAALQILSKVFGELSNVKLIVVSDMKLPINIAENFKTSGLGYYKVFDKSLEKIFDEKNKDLGKKQSFMNLLKEFDMIMVGYKNQLKLIDKEFVKKILKERKQKPIFFVDCGIPGNIDVNIGNIPNCFLFDLNDLEQLYSSWIQNNINDEHTDRELYDIELKSLMDSFFGKLNFTLEQKMIYEKRVNFLIQTKGREMKANLKKFLKIF